MSELEICKLDKTLTIVTVDPKLIEDKVKIDLTKIKIRSLHPKLKLS